MKLKQGFYTQSFRGKELLLASGAAAEQFRGVARLSETSAFIVEHLKTDTTEAAVVAALLEAYNVTPELAARDVRRIVEKLNEIGALE